MDNASSSWVRYVFCQDFSYSDLILSPETCLGEFCSLDVSWNSLVFIKREILTPKSLSVTVHVTDSHGKILHEWGIQYLRQHGEGKRVSAYVQSETDVSFQISLQPDIPFIAHVPTSGGVNNPPVRGKSRRPKLGLEDHSLDRDHKKMSANTLSSPARPFTTSKSHSAPGFAFLAVLYLDGRRKPERKISKSCFRSFVALLRLFFGVVRRS